MPNMPMQPSRRAMLKVGAHAAWAVPAIQIAAATPAFAASPTHAAVLSFTGDITRNGSNGHAKLTLQNTGNGGVVDPTVTISGAGVDFTKPITTTSAGWTPSVGAASVTFTHTGTLAATSSLPVFIEFSVANASNSAANVVSVAATGTKAVTTDGAVGDGAKNATI